MKSQTIAKRLGINFSEGRVQITAEMYNLLQFTQKNRPINMDLVNRLKASVLRHGVLRLVIVVWDSIKQRYLIVDGQHLTVALKQLNRNIECVIVDCETEEEMVQLMIDLNNISKSWTLENYIHSWAESGVKSYKQLRVATQLSDVQLTVAMQAYTQQSRAKATKMVKEGKFEIVNKQRGDELIEYVSECSAILPNTRQMNEALIKLMLKIEFYNHKHMIKRIKAVVKTFVFSTKEGELYKQLLGIYNGK